MGYGAGGLWGTLYILFVAGIILFLAYIVTRTIGTKYMKTLKGKNITVLESVSLGIDKVLYIVSIGEQYFLISSSGKNINLLGEINKTNISSEKQNPSLNNSFIDGSSFTKYLDMFKNKFPSGNSDENKETVKDDIQNIDKNVEKIRDIFNNIKVSDKDGVES